MANTNHTSDHNENTTQTTAWWTKEGTDFDGMPLPLVAIPTDPSLPPRESGVDWYRIPDDMGYPLSPDTLAEVLAAAGEPDHHEELGCERWEEVAMEIGAEEEHGESATLDVLVLSRLIAAWDSWDVYELRDMLAGLRVALEDEGQGRRLEEVVDTADLPSAPMPDWVDTSWPVWARDEQGRYLVGATLDEVVSEDELRETMKD